MQRLYARIAGSVILAVLVGWTAVGLLVPRMRTAMEENVAEQLVNGGLGAIAARLDTASADTWPALLADASQLVAFRLAIVEADELPPAVRRARDRPMLAAPDGSGPASLYIPLRTGGHHLVAGPLRPPPVTPFVTIAVVFVVVLTVTASALVGIPLVRRLRKVRDALAAIGGGNWATRLDANAEGALGELAGSVNAMAAQLEQQFQERESLLQTVSHEIGTPLSRMRFRLERLEQDASTPEAHARLGAIAADLDELDELSSELVGWMEADAPPQPQRSIDVRLVLESLVELERPPASGPLETVILAPDHVRVKADERAFQRAMENLLRNALRYASRAIVIDVIEDGDRVAIEVRDDGPGIPPEDRSRVLEPFIRGPVQARTHRGLGLGLAIVRRIMAAHGGTLSVGRAPEGGAAFRTTWTRAA